MKTLVVGWALVVTLLFGPVLARPNLVEPIYLRRRTNPLEIIEESVEAGSAANGSSPASAGDQSTEQQAPVSAETKQQQQQQTTAASAAASSDASTGTTGTSTSDRGTTQQPSYSAYKRPSELLKTKIGTSGFVVSTSTKVLTGGDRTPGASALSFKSGEAKANDQLTLSFQDRFTGHAGVAEPLTDEEYQNELHRATERVPVRTTTTPREGLSTWVLLSGSDSTETKAASTSTTTRKVQIMQTTTMKPAAAAAMGSTTKRYQTPTMRRNLPSTTQRPVKTTTAVTGEEKKEKPTKPIPKQKVATTTLKPVIVKKVKKPPATTTTTAAATTPRTTTPAPKPSTTTTTTTTTSTSTTTELVLTEQSASTVANDQPARDEPVGTPGDSDSDSSVETSTFLIMEPKDAMFDLPEDRSPSKVAPVATKTKTKVTRKPNVKSQPANGTKNKKPANKKNRKPEVKDGVTKPPNKNGAAKPVSTQIINYLSREVMPTVGVGLVGLVMAAGLASYFLGSPLGALRRSDDRKDDLYYSNYEEYAGPDGQNEEDVFGKLIAGMPDRSYYRNNANVRRRIQQQQQQQAPVRTGHQYYHVQPYTGNKYPHITYRNRAYNGGGASAPDMYSNINRQVQVQAKAQNLASEFHYTPPTPYYPARMSPASSDVATGRPAPPMAPVYSASASQPAAAAVPTPTTTTTTTTSMPATESPLQDGEAEHEMMPHPEAYSSEHSPEHHAHYVVGAVGSSYADSMLDMINSASMPEHGPRKRRAVAATVSASSEEAEFDNEINVDDDDEYAKESSNAAVTEEVPVQTEAESDSTVSSVTTMSPEMTTEVHRYTWGDFIRNTVERKVKLGLNFLQHVTMDFQRYLNGVQEHLVAQHSSSEPAEH
ncbi:mucin-5AC-like [Anopheles albimanus]|uniref:mucin-5AC-like n=1 Tax=Anopheles albimanus TaxID=7167 RepID=UPI00163F9D7C|nr:mucin-5AC-like [Anopheles albimanus]XP_035777665.1 mucin-5AC-like [Anopheles albimanus]